jgi:hypothetical protein
VELVDYMKEVNAAAGESRDLSPGFETEIRGYFLRPHECSRRDGANPLSIYETLKMPVSSWSRNFVYDTSL